MHATVSKYPFQDEGTTNSAAVNRSGLFREIFVNNLNNLEEDVTPSPTVDVVIRDAIQCCREIFLMTFIDMLTHIFSTFCHQG